MSFFRHVLSDFPRLDRGGDGRISVGDLLPLLQDRALPAPDAAAVATLRWLLPRRGPGWGREELQRYEEERERDYGAAPQWHTAFEDARLYLENPERNRELVATDDAPQWWRYLHQGRQNDCWFVSALITLARHRPEEVRRLVIPAGEGRYDVTFPGHPVVRGVRVTDAELACYRPYAFLRDGMLLPVLEKAYGTLLNRRSPAPMEEVDQPTPRPGKSVRLLTGHGSRIYYLTRGPFGWWRKVVARRIAEASRADPPRLMTVSDTNFRRGHVFALVSCESNAEAITLQDPYAADVLAPLPLDELIRRYTFLIVESRGNDGGFF
jgi:hypothetical protein